MNTEMGEYLVGAYLKIIEGCEFPGGGLKGLAIPIPQELRALFKRELQPPSK